MLSICSFSLYSLFSTSTNSISTPTRSILDWIISRLGDSVFFIISLIFFDSEKIDLIVNQTATIKNHLEKNLKLLLLEIEDLQDCFLNLKCNLLIFYFFLELFFVLNFGVHQYFFLPQFLRNRHFGGRFC